jgi:hypothetical protein
MAHGKNPMILIEKLLPHLLFVAALLPTVLVLAAVVLSLAKG